eukprot:6409-Heterococcus_DN1.PRE.1
MTTSPHLDDMLHSTHRTNFKLPTLTITPITTASTNKRYAQHAIEHLTAASKIVVVVLLQVTDLDSEVVLSAGHAQQHLLQLPLALLHSPQHSSLSSRALANAPGVQRACSAVDAGSDPPSLDESCCTGLCCCWRGAKDCCYAV